MVDRRARMADLAARAKLGTPGTLSPAIVRSLRRVIGPWLRVMFRPRWHGWEHLPRDRPYLLVSNHSGGGVIEILCLAYLWVQRHPEGRPIAGLAHPAAFHAPVLGDLMRSLGAVPSTYEAAAAALRDGLPVLVFPGGDHEAFRPLWQARRVDFGGRKGFLRIARRAGVPVVPMGIRGSHWTLPIAFRSRWLARALFLDRLMGGARVPVTVTGVIGAGWILGGAGPALGYPLAALLAFLWALGPLNGMFLVPWTISIRTGAPIAADELFGDAADETADETDDEALLASAYDRVEAAVRALTRVR